MKSTFGKGLVFLCISLFSLSGSAQEIDIQNGTEFIYDRRGNGLAGEVIVEVISNTDRELIFKVKEPSMNIEGTKTVSSELLRSSHHFSPPFGPGNTVFKDKTMTWVSQKILSAILKGTTTLESTCCSEETETLGYEKYKVLMNGRKKTLKVVHIKTDVGFEYWIWKNKKNPLIVKAHQGWSLDLKEIQTP